MKIKYIIWNVLLLIMYLVCVLVLEAFCTAKLIMDPGWHWFYDVIIILILICTLVPHYKVLRSLHLHNGLAKTLRIFLIVFDFLLTAAVLSFLFLPNRVIGKPIISTHLFLSLIHIQKFYS